MHYSVPPNLPKMREIEGNLKKSYGKLAAQIWLGPCHWIKTQSDRSCFLSDIHKNCLCHTWVVCLILRRELRVTGDETQRTIWTRRKRSEAMSRQFSPSLLPLRAWEKDFGVQERVVLHHRASVHGSIIRNSPEEVSCRD